MSDDEKHSKWEDLAKDADTENSAGEESLDQDASEEISEEQPMEDVQKVLEEAQSQADEYKNKLLRVHAELENVQRRAQQDLSKAHKFGLEKFANSLLPVVDSLERGLDVEHDEHEKLVAMREGLELTLKMFLDVLERFGIEQLDPKGDPFDPSHHEAMSMQPSNEVDPGTVLTVLQKGYTLNDRLIRPAMVVVAK